ncbi:MAG: hypothetical protein JO215_13505, partial [Ktedonobacteraceae bacterium]|nr:hypothetical protein [Ktedonobacteraceae bacterium]
MNELKPIASGAIAIDEHWDIALKDALAQVAQGAPAEDRDVDLVLLFISSEFVGHYSQI